MPTLTFIRSMMIQSRCHRRAMQFHMSKYVFVEKKNLRRLVLGYIGADFCKKRVLVVFNVLQIFWGSTNLRSAPILDISIKISTMSKLSKFGEI